MKLTTRWLKSHGACSEAIEAFKAQDETDVIIIARKLIRRGKDTDFDWCNWLLTRKMNKRQRVEYAVYAARQVLANFEKQYPGDNRPRQAIEAAEAYFKNPSARTKSAAESAAWSAAKSAARSAWSARLAAWSAAWSARLTAGSAESAAKSAAKSAARSAAWSARLTAETKMKKKILRRGIKILEEP